MVNKQRGEVEIEGPEGKKYTMCLSLGAIAQMEEALGLESLSQIDTVMNKGRMRNVITIFLALLHGGGHDELGPDDMMKWRVPLRELMEKIRECFVASGFVDPDGEGEERENSEGGDPPQGN